MSGYRFKIGHFAPTAMFCEHLSHKIRKNEHTNTAEEDVKMHVCKISVGQKVVGQTLWLVHWEQKVGGQLPILPNRLRRQCSSDCSQSSEKVSRESVNPYSLALRKILFKRPIINTNVTTPGRQCIQQAHLTSSCPRYSCNTFRCNWWSAGKRG